GGVRRRRDPDRGHGSGRRGCARRGGVGGPRVGRADVARFRDGRPRLLGCTRPFRYLAVMTRQSASKTILSAAVLFLVGCETDDRTPLVIYSPHGADMLTAFEERYEELNPDIDV